MCNLRCFEILYCTITIYRECILIVSNIYSQVICQYTIYIDMILYFASCIFSANV